MRPSAPAPNTKSLSTTRSPSTTRSTHGTKKAQKQSFRSDPALIPGIPPTPISRIYERNDYASAIDQLKALGHDDYANVANLIGYSYCKLGDYKLSQVWVHERALKSDPKHVLTWNYYGLWSIQ